MKTILICGSRNPQGQTAQAADAVLKGVAKAGGSTERVFLPTLKIESCRQCDDNGWGLCRKEGSCVIDDDLSGLVEKMREADAVVCATPVYYSDLSESLRAFADRLRRACTHEAGRVSIKGKPVIGVCVAGGGGGGAPACCVSLERVLTTCGLDVVDMIPVRRQNLHAKLAILELAGQWLACLGEDRPVVGAIRWDAWTGGQVTEQVERTLGPRKYHDRLPWFAEVVDDQTVRIDGGRQGVMDREIAFAADAGLDYWAFLLYPEESAMSQSLTHYLASVHRGRMNFCLILHNAFGVSEDQWPRERDRAVALLKEPGYQTVLDGRPLVYAFQVRYEGRFPAERFAEFRHAAKDAGLNPYCVFMGWSPRDDYAREQNHGFDAVSAYAYGSADVTFSALARAVENRYWKNAAEAGVPYIPLVTTGWDKQPRKDNPVSWETGHSYHQQNVFPSTAEPHEIASHLYRALAFVRDNRSVCEANAIIVYAWNEHDEGGWLVPTWVPDGTPKTARLEAIRGMLRPDNSAEALK